MDKKSYFWEVRECSTNAKSIQRFKENLQKSSLGKRSRCENMVSQDYSSYDDLTSLESVSPAQEFYSRFSNMVIFAPTKSEPISVTPVENSSLESTSDDLQKSVSIEAVEARTKSKEGWGWFVQEEDQIFLS